MQRRPPDTRRGRSLGLRLALAVLVTAGLFALTAPERPEGKGDDDLSVMLAEGTLSHDNSRNGSAILTAKNISPGWAGYGNVTITNTGVAAWLRLTEGYIGDFPGPAGGKLSERMQLVIEDASVAGFPVPLYTGPLGAVGERWLGHMTPGEERKFRFSTSMPETLTDNAYQASGVDVRFDWAVTGDVAADPPVDPPATPVDPPATPVDPPATPVDPPDVVVVPDGPPVVVVNRGKLGVKLAIPTSQRPLRRRNLLALASCSRRCTATLSGRVSVLKAGAGGMKIAGVSRAFSAGIQKRVKLRVPRKAVKAARRAFRRGRSVRGRVDMVATDAHGRVARATQRIKLVPVRRR